MKKRVSTRMAKDWFITIGYIGLWYVGIAIIVNIVSKVVSMFDLPDFSGNELLQVSSAISYVFMLVIGIVLPLVYQKYYVSLGITRRQMTQGMLLALLAFAFLFALAHAAIYLLLSLAGSAPVNPGAIPLQWARDFILFIFYYLVGWLIAWGFTYARFITAAPAILIGVLAVQGASFLLGDPLIALDASPGLLPEPAVLGIALAATVILMIALSALLKRVPFKVS